MRTVIQRVSEASVIFNEADRSIPPRRINAGLLIFLGIEEADTIEDIEWLSAKLVNLRIFSDAEGL